MGYVSRACEYTRGWGEGRLYGKKEVKRQFVIRSFESRFGKLDEISRNRISHFDEEQLDRLLSILLPSPPSNMYSDLSVWLDNFDLTRGEGPLITAAYGSQDLST